MRLPHFVQRDHGSCRRDHFPAQRFRFQHFGLTAKAESELAGFFLHVETDGQRGPALRIRRSAVLNARRSGAVVHPARHIRADADLRVEARESGLKFRG